MKSNSSPVIVGAGLAGLLAAHAWPSSVVLESAKQPAEMHKAVLRFRSNAVARLTGIDFRAVRVHKGIWFRGQFVRPSILMANLYAQKCMGGGVLRGERSIWNLDAAERYIAPESFYEQLIEAVGARISWGIDVSFDALPITSGPVVSTAPLSVVASQRKMAEFSEFRRAGITVRRWRIPNADVFQTIYFTDRAHTLYRASITGDLLIAEFASNFALGAPDTEQAAHDDLFTAFGLDPANLEFLGESSQRFGKIDPIPDARRKQLLFQLTHEAGLYSLGRFATWRNILLDDVVDDIAVIKRLLRANSSYELRKAAS